MSCVPETLTYHTGGACCRRRCYNHTPAISSRHSILDTFYQCLSYTTDALVYAQSL